MSAHWQVLCYCFKRLDGCQLYVLWHQGQQVHVGTTVYRLNQQLIRDRLGWTGPHTMVALLLLLLARTCACRAKSMQQHSSRR
jgi:hypothetical protein